VLGETVAELFDQALPGLPVQLLGQGHDNAVDDPGIFAIVSFLPIKP